MTAQVTAPAPFSGPFGSEVQVAPSVTFSRVAPDLMKVESRNDSTGSVTTIGMTVPESLLVAAAMALDCSKPGLGVRRDGASMPNMRFRIQDERIFFEDGSAGISLSTKDFCRFLHNNDWLTPMQDEFGRIEHISAVASEGRFPSPCLTTDRFCPESGYVFALTAGAKGYGVQIENPDGSLRTTVPVAALQSVARILGGTYEATDKLAENTPYTGEIVIDREKGNVTFPAGAEMPQIAAPLEDVMDYLRCSGWTFPEKV